MRARGRRACAGARRALLAAAVALACAPRPWDLSALESRHPQLAALGAHRLGDATPYLLPLDGTLTLFLCRWPSGAAIPLRLPPDATARERALLSRAVDAWERLELGIRFARGADLGDGGIEIRFAGDAVSAVHAAATRADCAVDASPSALPPGGAPVLAARLRSSIVSLRRTQLDWRGQPVAHTDDELVGSLLHELGHALGFQGHALRGETAMVYSVDHVRWAGRRLLAGDGFRDATLRALYRVPSGTVVGRARLSAAQTGPADALARLAPRLGLRGPLVRVGDRAARIAWRDGAGRSFALVVFGIPEVLRRPQGLEVLPLPRARALLARHALWPVGGAAPDQP